MPAGVEHSTFVRSGERPVDASVIDSVMPAGVEHMYSYGPLRNVGHVIDSVMPAGVEHRVTAGP